MPHRIKSIGLVIFLLLWSTVFHANPDVSFRDSSVYLKHELSGVKVKFLLSEKVPGFELPDEFLSANKFLTYVDKKHVFSKPGLKLEFIRMMRMSIESQFTFREFMTELIAALDGFLSAAGESDDSDGCSAISTPSSTYLFLACVLYYGWRRRALVEARIERREAS